MSADNVLNCDDSDAQDEVDHFIDESNSSAHLEADDFLGEDNDAPEGVSWKESKAAFHQNEKNRSEAVNFSRSVDKARRRKKNELFVSQKQTKRKLSKLPEDIVQAIAKMPKQIESNEMSREEGKRMEKKSKKRKSERKKEHSHVVILEDVVKKPKKVQETAAEFLKTHLYGNRLERTAGSAQLTMRCKSSGKMKPALKFKTKV